jgi:hypothetical protein
MDEPQRQFGRLQVAILAVLAITALVVIFRPELLPAGIGIGIPAVIALIVIGWINREDD